MARNFGIRGALRSFVLMAVTTATLANASMAFADAPFPQVVVDGCLKCSTATVHGVDDALPFVGSSLRCNPGDWAGTQPMQMTIVWQVRGEGERVWHPIVDAPRLKLTRAYVHKAVRCVVLAMNADGIGLAIARARWVTRDKDDDWTTGAAGVDDAAATHGAPMNPPRGTVNADRLIGGAGDDLLDAGDGDDVVVGGAGNDILRGGPGADRLLGGAGDDLVRGGSGADTIKAGTGRDTIFGDAGNDLIIVSGDRMVDVVFCGPGNDRVIADPTDIVALDCERVIRTRR